MIKQVIENLKKKIFQINIYFLFKKTEIQKIILNLIKKIISIIQEKGNFNFRIILKKIYLISHTKENEFYFF